jgi:uncharacterized membrane protein AbrB (regulator of aidB expression)
VAGRRAPAPNWLYIFIVLILGATLIAGVVSWIWLTFENKQLPDGLATVLATIAGGLVGVLTMGDGRAARAERGPAPDEGEPR